MVSSRKFSWQKAGLIGIFVFLILLSFNSSIRSAGQYIFGSVAKPFFNIGRSILTNSDKQTILNKNNELTNRLTTLMVDYSELELLRKENNILRKELNYIKENKSTYQVADILTTSSVAELNILILNKGQKDNIMVGMPVISEGGVMVGKIFKVEEFTSQLMLINNDNISVSVSAQNSQETTGIVSGNNNLTILMDFVPLNKTIEVGDMVVTSGREKYIPSGLTIGQITFVNRKDNDFFQTATIDSPINLLNLKQVIILTGSHAGE